MSDPWSSDAWRELAKPCDMDAAVARAHDETVRVLVEEAMAEALRGFPHRGEGLLAPGAVWLAEYLITERVIRDASLVDRFRADPEGVVREAWKRLKGEKA